MKKRFGFVSNSSSSSFVLFASKEVFDAALNECTEIQKKAVEGYITEDKEAFGKQMYRFDYFHSSEEYDDDICDLVDEYFPDREGDDYKEVEKLTDFVFEGGFDKILTQKAEEMGESTLSHGDYR